MAAYLSCMTWHFLDDSSAIQVMSTNILFEVRRNHDFYPLRHLHKIYFFTKDPLTPISSLCFMFTDILGSKFTAAKPRVID